MTRGSRTSDSRGKGYQSKRNLSATPEPTWKTQRKRTKRGKQFVIHKHAARNLHYDLRLEIEGALASWAVPKGLPVKRGEKHLAIKVEDHPIDYGEFEGNIPPDNYGAGTVMLWDSGLYEVLENDPGEAVRKGHLSLVLAGRKLRGDWHLVRTREKGDKEEWLLIKGKEGDLNISAEEDDRSVASGRTMAEIAGEKNAADAKRKGKKSNSPTKKKFPANLLPRDLPDEAPAFAPPMKPHLSTQLPSHGDWIYEIKFDGYRVVAVKDDNETTLYSRNHKDVSRDFPEIHRAIAQLPISRAVIDGEIVALLESGLSSFQRLQNRGRSNGRNRPPIFCYAFDLLNLEGKNTTSLPLHRRKDLLQEILAGQKDPLRFSAGIDSEPEHFLSQAREMGLEGLIAKETESTYRSGRRTRSWLKIKLHHQQEFVIGGYTEPKGSRSRFGAILLGLYEKDGLHYVGRAGTGFDERTLEDAYQRFQDLRADQCPFVNLPSPRRGSFGGGLTGTDMKRCVWLAPKIVCEVKFSEWTDDESIRQPVFLGFRDDKSPREAKREHPVA